MANSKDAKVLSPIKRKNKSGKVYQGRISVVVDGFRKVEIVGTYPTEQEAIDASKDYIENKGRLLTDDLVETDISLGVFFETIYKDWYIKTFKTFDFSAIGRFLAENNFLDVPLQKINKRWCRNFRKEIINFKKPNGKEYVLKGLYIKLVGHLSNMLRLADDMGYIKENYNDRLENPHTQHARWESDREAKHRKTKMLKTTTWTKEQVRKYLPLFETISETQLIKRTTRAEAKSRKANVMKSDNAESWKVYWVDNDGIYRAKNFNWKKCKGRERAKILADAYAEEITLTLEQSDGTYISEVRTFREVDPIMWWAYFVLNIVLGLRNAEICGLKFSDFDKRTGMVSIDRHLALRTSGGKREMIYDNPKKDSFRSFAYGAMVQRVLDSLALYYQTNENNLDDSLLQYRTGGAVAPDYWTKNYRKAQTKAGISEHEQLKTTHKGRHTSLTLLAKANVSPQKLIRRAGHKKFQTTMDYYIDELGDQDTADTMDEIISPSKPDIVEVM